MAKGARFIGKEGDTIITSQIKPIPKVKIHNIARPENKEDKYD